MALKKLLTAAVCALLSACASTPRSLPAEKVAAYRDDIALSGRLLVNYQKDGKAASVSGSFNWQQSAARTDVSLISPLGQTVAVINVTPGEAVLTQNGQAPRRAADIDTLSAQALGWALPVSGLRDWLQGYAQGADGRRFVASPQNDSVTTRDGWRLRYVSWQDGAASSPQPRRIDAERSASLHSDEVAIRIVIDPQVQP